MADIIRASFASFAFLLISDPKNGFPGGHLRPLNAPSVAKAANPPRGESQENGDQVPPLWCQRVPLLKGDEKPQCWRWDSNLGDRCRLIGTGEPNVTT